MHLHYNIMKFPANIVEQVRKHLDPTPCGLVRHLVEAGHEAYIVGGAIRDLLLGASPKDYDIVTSATPEEIRRVFGRRRCHIIGRRFRLVHVYANGDLYEISTFRRIPSEKERQGRHANGDDHIILFLAHSCHKAVTGDACVVDEDIYRAETLFYLLDCLFDLFKI